MQRIWATAATVWAVLGVTAALAWAQTQPPATVPAPSTAPSTSPAKGATPAGTGQRRRRRSGPRHHPHLMSARLHGRALPRHGLRLRGPA